MPPNRLSDCQAVAKGWSEPLLALTGCSVRGYKGMDSDPAETQVLRGVYWLDSCTDQHSRQSGQVDALRSTVQEGDARCRTGRLSWS